MLRRDQRPVDGQRTGVIRRPQILRPRSSTARRDWLAFIAVGVLAVVVLFFISGALGAGPTSTLLPTATPVPTRSQAAVFVQESPAPTATPRPTPSPTPIPIPSPTPPVTPSPTASPTLPPTPSPTPSPILSATPVPVVPAAALAIIEPADGAVSNVSVIFVRGIAAPGATITRDIPLWFDDHTIADIAGNWSLAVQLGAGANLLTFRIDDDTSTAKTVTVWYRP